MLTKKLKKIGKESRATEDPVLLTLATYLDHVVDYLGRAKSDGVKAEDYGNALARLDLSAVLKAHEALVIEPAVEEQACTTAVDSCGEEDEKAAKKAKKKKKAKNKVEETQAVAAVPTPQEADAPAEPPAESPSGEEGKKRKKNKKKKGK